MSLPINDNSSLLPVAVNFSPGEEFSSQRREFQGIPSIAATSDSRVWATWYGGGKDEGASNYVIVVRSDDAGDTWSQPVVAISPGGNIRAFDPTIWCDPQGRLWLFWAQGLSTQEHPVWDGRAGVWAIVCENPDAKELLWSEPRRISDGIMLNQPVVLFDGSWILPVSIWGIEPFHPDVEGRRLAGVVRSENHGKSFKWIGGAEIPNRSFDEHCIVQRNDGSLLLLARTKDGIAVSVSSDGGRNWSMGRKGKLPCPDSRFYLTRLASGNLLLVNHHNYVPIPEDKSPLRNHLTAMLSEDDGESWSGFLLLDERGEISYPNGVQTEDGIIHVIYDRNRYSDREILLASFTEDDVRYSKAQLPSVRLRHIVDPHS